MLIRKIGIKACIMNEYLAIKPLPIKSIIMGRAWQIECEGVLYNLMFQGNNEQDVYLKKGLYT